MNSSCRQTPTHIELFIPFFWFMISGEDLSWLLKQWKTINMDVDARGRPCKERMLQILLRYENLQKIL
jgi:hypothetical protein